MTGFAPGEIATIRDFAGQLGLQAQAAADGSFTFVFQASGTLTLTPSRSDGRVIVSLARRGRFLDADVLARVLRQAGHDPGRGRMLHAGLASDDSLVYATSLAEGSLSLPLLDDCLQQLRAAHDALR